jgi:two-component system, NarL family, invasion response regulator UvrY
MRKVKRILVADDHLLLREGLRQLFEYVEDIQIGAEAASGEEVLSILAADSFDLLLLDISLPGIHGEDLILKIRQTGFSLPILILSMHNEPIMAIRMLKAGATGFITKGSSSNELLEAIRKVALGRRFIAAEIAEAIFFTEALGAVAGAPHESLTKRESLVLRMLAQGNSVNQIARILHLSNKTVSSHKSKLMEKMQMTSFAELMQYAITHGLNV